ncbi:odorant receptor 13a-like [Anthonomus grandis grandis]|uniref:odorant receptor 13a-like n=1 Tax=Anthonomus grandis grandis TaxID=2921223 RepID=UPI0021667596|nr:odorant receptor 13a-like [Anthonomus grandis grandis]
MMPHLSLKETLDGCLKRVYTGIIYLLAILCFLSEVFKLYQLLAAENMIVEEVIRNYTITSIHFAALVKCLFVRGQVSGEFFKKILRYEEQIYASQNDQVISIYEKVLLANQNLKSYYLAGIVLTVIFYITAPALRDPYYVEYGNTTVIIPQLPLSSWTPFDNSYWIAFVWTSCVGAYLSIFFVTTDLTCYSFILFAICQTKILHHYISNFFWYAKNVRAKLMCSEVESYRVMQKECIIIHQEIINYVKRLNDSIKYIMILDFLPSSIQLAGLTFQIITNLNVIQCILLGQFISTLVARVYIYCNTAHDLFLESQRISYAWYEIDWTVLPSDVRINMMFSIMRAQKPLRITIGDFQKISLETFLVILKGTYSYMMLLLTAI